MKVLLINGSPHKEGSTYTALSEIASELEARGIEAEIFHIGTAPISGCLACGKCRADNLRKCAIDDAVNEVIDRARESDGFIFGAPVHYASPNGPMLCLMDRLFFCKSGAFDFKPAASVLAARRAGSTSAYDVLNKYYGINKMITLPSVYWNMVIGYDPEQVKKDAEGMEIMRTLGMNMAWMLKVLKAAKDAGINEPE
jgi:multimeric flavodoxin WrbA